MCHHDAREGGSAQLATPGLRLGAQVLDVTILALLFVLSYFVAFIYYDQSGESTGANLLVLAGPAVYTVWMLVAMARGATPGKELLRLRVVDEAGHRASFWRMLLRDIVGKFVSSLVLYLGYLAILWDRDNQGWHDKLASTYVVDESVLQEPTSPRWARVALPVVGLFVLVAAAIGAAHLLYNDAAPGAQRVAEVPEYVEVTYDLGGFFPAGPGGPPSVDLTYTDGSGNIQQQSRRAFPLQPDGGITFSMRSGDYASFSAQDNSGRADELECAIYADGVRIDTGRAYGPYSIVSCSVTVP